MRKKSPEEYYQTCQKGINSMCKSSAVYLRLDVDELISLSNEIFTICYSKFSIGRMTFQQYFFSVLKNKIKSYWRKEKQKSIKKEKYLLLQKNEINIKNEEQTHQKNEKNQIKIEKNTKKLIKKIKNLCLDAEIDKKIEKYTKKRTNKLNIIPKYAIFNFFYDQGYSGYQINKAFNTIKRLLKENLI